MWTITEQPLTTWLFLTRRTSISVVKLTDPCHIFCREILGNTLFIRDVIIEIVAPGLHR